MPLFQQIKTTPLYIHYFLKVVDTHSIQAPFAYHIYRQILNSLKELEINGKIEEERSRFKEDKTLVKGNNLGAESHVSGTRTISSIAKYGISNQKDCLLLLALVSIFKPKKILELGTSLGISTAYLATSNNAGKVYTIEGNPQLVEASEHLFMRLNLQNISLKQGDIDQVLPGLLAKIGEIDMAIIDANHTEEALIRYFENIKSNMSDNGIIVVDDIRWATGMYRGWQKLIQSAEVGLSMEFRHKGILIFKKGLQKQHYILSY